MGIKSVERKESYKIWESGLLKEKNPSKKYGNHVCWKKRIFLKNMGIKSIERKESFYKIWGSSLLQVGKTDAPRHVKLQNLMTENVLTSGRRFYQWKKTFPLSKDITARRHYCMKKTLQIEKRPTARRPYRWIKSLPLAESHTSRRSNYCGKKTFQIEDLTARRRPCQ